MASADVSGPLDESIRRELAIRRPRADGFLVVTEDALELARQAQSFFAARAAMSFYVFLGHWSDAGAFVIRGDTLAQVSMKLPEFDTDSVYGCDDRRSEVFSLDRTEEPDGQIVWELFHFVTGSS